jgi:hypothetical protein
MVTTGTDCTLPFGTEVLHLLQINHQPDATVFQFIILTLLMMGGKTPETC